MQTLGDSTAGHGDSANYIIRFLRAVDATDSSTDLGSLIPDDASESRLLGFELVTRLWLFGKTAGWCLEDIAQIPMMPRPFGPPATDPHNTTRAVVSFLGLSNEYRTAGSLEHWCNHTFHTEQGGSAEWSFGEFWDAFASRILSFKQTAGGSSRVAILQLRAHCLRHLVEILSAFVSVPVDIPDHELELELAQPVKDALALCVCADRGYANKQFSPRLLTSMLVRVAGLQRAFQAANKSSDAVANWLAVAKIVNRRVCALRTAISSSVKARTRVKASTLSNSQTGHEHRDPINEIATSPPAFAADVASSAKSSVPPTSDLLVPLVLRKRQRTVQYSAGLQNPIGFPNTTTAAIALSQIEVDCFNRCLQHLSFFKYDPPARSFLHIPASDLDWISNHAPLVPMVLGLNRKYGDDRPEVSVCEPWRPFKHRSEGDFDSSEHLASGRDLFLWVGFNHMHHSTGQVWAVPLKSFVPSQLSWGAVGGLNDVLTTHCNFSGVRQYWSPATTLMLRTPTQQGGLRMMPQSLKPDQGNSNLMMASSNRANVSPGASALSFLSHDEVAVPSDEEISPLDLTLDDTQESEVVTFRNDEPDASTSTQLIAIPHNAERAAAADQHAIQYKISTATPLPSPLFHPRERPEYLPLWEFVKTGVLALEVILADWRDSKSQWSRPFVGDNSCWLNSYALFLWSFIPLEGGLFCECIADFASRIKTLDESDAAFCDTELLASLATLALVGVAVQACTEVAAAAQRHLEHRIDEARGMLVVLEDFAHDDGYACPMQTHNHVVRGLTTVLGLHCPGPSRHVVALQRRFGVICLIPGVYRLRQDALHIDSRVSIEGHEGKLNTAFPLNQVISKALQAARHLSVLRLPSFLLVSIEQPTAVTFKATLSASDTAKMEHVTLLALWTYNKEHFVTYLGKPGGNTVAEITSEQQFVATQINNMRWSERSNVRCPSSRAVQNVNHVSFLLFKLSDEFTESLDELSQHTFVSPVVFRTPEHIEPCVLQGAEGKRKRKAAAEKIKLKVCLSPSGTNAATSFPGYAKKSDICSTVPPWLVNLPEAGHDVDVNDIFSAFGLTTLCTYLNTCCARMSNAQPAAKVYFAPWWLLANVDSASNVRWTQATDAVDTSRLICLPHINQASMRPLGMVFVDIREASVAYYDISSFTYSGDPAFQETARAAILILKKYLKLDITEWRYLTPHHQDGVFIDLGHDRPVSKQNQIDPEVYRKILFAHLLVACCAPELCGTHDILLSCPEDATQIIENITIRCTFQSLLSRCHNATSLGTSAVTISDIAAFYRIHSELEDLRALGELDGGHVHSTIDGMLPIESTHGPILVPVGLEDVEAMLGRARSGFVHGSAVEAYVSAILHRKRKEVFYATAPTLHELVSFCAFVNRDYELAESCALDEDGILRLKDSASSTAKRRTFEAALKVGLQCHSPLAYSSICAVLGDGSHFIALHINPGVKTVRVYDSLNETMSLSFTFKAQILYLCFVIDSLARDTGDTNTDPWSIQVCQSPQQDTSAGIFDCAIYAMFAALCVSHGRVPYISFNSGATYARRWLVEQVVEAYCTVVSHRL